MCRRQARACVEQHLCGFGEGACCLSTNYRYLPTGMIGLNSKNLSLPRQKSEAGFVVPAVEGEKPTCISFL